MIKVLAGNLYSQRGYEQILVLFSGTVNHLGAFRAANDIELQNVGANDGKGESTTVRGGGDDPRECLLSDGAVVAQCQTLLKKVFVQVLQRDTGLDRDRFALGVNLTRRISDISLMRMRHPYLQDLLHAVHTDHPLIGTCQIAWAMSNAGRPQCFTFSSRPFSYQSAFVGGTRNERFLRMTLEGASPVEECCFR